MAARAPQESAPLAASSTVHHHAPSCRDTVTQITATLKRVAALPGIEVAQLEEVPLPPWLPWRALAGRWQHEPVQEVRLGYAGLGGSVSRTLLGDGVASYLVVTSSAVVFTAPTFHPALYRAVVKAAATAGGWHETRCSGMKELAAAVYSGEEGLTPARAARAEALTQPWLVLVGEVMPADPTATAAAAAAEAGGSPTTGDRVRVPPLLESAHLDWEPALGAGRRAARDRQLEDWVREQWRRSHAPETPGVVDWALVAARLVGAGPAEERAVATKLRDPVASAEFAWPLLYASVLAEVTATDAARSAASRVLQLRYGDARAVAATAGGAVSSGTLGMEAARATEAARTGQRPAYKPHAHDPDSMVELFARHMPPVAEGWRPRELPPPTAGHKPYLQWDAFLAAHRLHHYCRADCLLARRLYDLATRWVIPWQGEERYVGQVETEAPTDAGDRAAMEEELAKLLASGVIKEVFGAEAEATQSLGIFVVQKFAYSRTSGGGGGGAAGAEEEAAERAAAVLRALTAADGSAPALERAVGLGATGGKRRVVYNAAPANPLIAALPFGMPTVDSLTTTLEEGDWVGMMDYKSAFWTFAPADSEERYMGIRWRGVRHGAGGETEPAPVRVFVWRRLGFGWRFAPAVCCTLTGELLRILRAATAAVGVTWPLCFVDDTAVRGGTEAAVHEAVRQACALLDALGVQVAQDKLLPPSQHAVVLGVQVHTDGTLRAGVTPEKRFDTLVRLQVVLAAAREPARYPYLPARYVEGLAGRLVWISRLYTGGRPYLAALHYAHGVAQDSASRGLPAHLLRGSRSSLEWWADSRRSEPVALVNDGGDRPMKTGLARGLTGRHLGLATDAAGACAAGAISGGVAVWARFRPEWLASGPSSTVVELYGVLVGLIAFGPQLRGHAVTLSSDSLCCVAAVNGGRTSSAAGRRLVKAIGWVAEEYGLVVVAGHVPREANSAADSLTNATSLTTAQELLTADWARRGAPGLPPTVVHAPIFTVREDGEIELHHRCNPPCLCRQPADAANHPAFAPDRGAGAASLGEEGRLD